MSSNVVPMTGAPGVPAFDSAGFRTACGKFATGITVVTLIDENGEPQGMTANSFTSVSLEPPLVLICIDRNATMLPRLQAAGTFGINVLNENQRDLSSHFARRGNNRFEGVPWTAGATGVPLLDNVLADYECKTTQVVDAGDHRIFIAEVLHVRCFSGKPLLYFASSYQTL